MVQLPFMEDIRQFVFGSLPGEKPAAQPSGKEKKTHRRICLLLFVCLCCC